MTERSDLSRREIAVLGVLLLAALGARLYALDVPGPYGDEMTRVLPAFQLAWGHPPAAYDVYVLGRWVPVAAGEYDGAFPIYVHALLFPFTKPKWFLFRVVDVGYALAFIVFTYLFARDFFGRALAWRAALLATSMPALVFYSRVGEHVIFLRTALASALLFCFYRWWQTDRWGYFYAGCATLGVGLSTRLEIVWWPIALTAYFLVAHHPGLRRLVQRLKARLGRTFVGLGYFLLGAGPFIIYNIAYPYITFKFVMKNFIQTQWGHSNLTLQTNLWKRLRDLAALLSGADGSNFGVPGLAFQNDTWPFVFFIGTALLTVHVAVRRWQGHPDRRVEFLLLTIGLMLGLSTFTVSGLRPMHLLMIMPIPVLLVVRALDLLRGRWAVVGLLLLAVLVVGDLGTDLRYYRALIETRGIGLYSSGIHDLVRYLRERGVRSVVACDWRLLHLVQFLSRGEIGGQEIFGYELGYEGVPASFYRHLEAALRDPQHVYLFYAPRYEQFKRHQAFLKYVQAKGLAHERHVLYDRNGPIYYVYWIREPQGKVLSVDLGKPREIP